VKRNGIAVRADGDSYVERFRCQKCGDEQRLPTVPEEENLRPLTKLREQDLEAIALYTQGYPLSQIRYETRVKQQTFRRKLARIHENNLWEQLRKLLERKFDAIFDEDGFWKLELEFRNRKRDDGVFRRAGQVTAKEFRERAWESEDGHLY